MDLSGIWGQLLLNASQTVCIRPNITLVQDIPQIIPSITLCQSNLSTSLDYNSHQSQEESENDVDDEDDNSDEEENTNEEEYSKDNADVKGEQEQGKDVAPDKTNEGSAKKSIQRTRYSREEYRCILCPYTCTTEKAYLRHLRHCEAKDMESSSKILPLSCPVCGKDRKDELTLSSHMEKHKNGKQFSCDLCKFKSVQLKKIIQHRRMHTGEKPHLCPHCKYRSSRRDNLRSHVRRVHKEENLTRDTFTPRSMLVTPTKRSS